MKKALMMVLSLVLVVALTIGGTLAYLTDRDSKANVFTVGNVSIKLNEDFEQGADLIPGKDIEKKPTITNTGKNDAWVWAEIAIPSALNDTTSAAGNVIHFNMSSESVADGLWNWWDGADYSEGAYMIKKDVEIGEAKYDIYTVQYETALKPGETTAEPVIYKVYLDTGVDIDPDGNWAVVKGGTVTEVDWNTDEDGNPVIYVSAYAVQTEGFATVYDAYDAYQTQWGTNGGEYAPIPALVSTSDELTDALANATAGAVISLEGGVDYGTVTVGELKDVVINGAEDAVLIFKTDANTKIENVTIKGAEFNYTGATADCGVVIDANAQIDNLVIDGCTFTGTGAKAGRGLSGLNNTATIELKNCTFKDIGYPIYAWGGYEDLTIDKCTFENIKSWAIMPQSGFDGDLTVTNCTFKDCLGGGLIKAGTLTAGHTFTFTGNTITGCTVAGDHNWFQFNVSAGTAVIANNTMDGNPWTPGVNDGLK